MIQGKAISSNVGYTKEQIDKIGNTIVYLSGHMKDLTKTKILKVLFLLEEASIKTTGHPFVGLNFQLWKLGPVAKDIFIDLSSDEHPTLLQEFIIRDDANDKIFKAKASFNDDEFSSNDIKLMDIIIDFVKDKPASYLVKHTHGANSLWRKSALQYGVLELLVPSFVAIDEADYLEGVDYVILDALLENEFEAIIMCFKTSNSVKNKIKKRL